MAWPPKKSAPEMSATVERVMFLSLFLSLSLSNCMLLLLETASHLFFSLVKAFDSFYLSFTSFQNWVSVVFGFCGRKLREPNSYICL